MAAEKDGSLLVIQGQQVLRIDPKSKQASPLITAGLQEPMSLWVDGAGSIYVSDRGTAQQVKVFGRDGKLVRTIGMDGGRSPRGPHQPQGMYKPHGLTVDAKGMLWVMEEDDRPQRISLWDAASGKFQREYVGPPHYGALHGCVSEFDRTLAFAEGVQYRLNWEDKSYSLVATVGRAASDEDPFGRAMVSRVFNREGRLLTASNTHVQVVCELKDGLLHPLAAVGEIDELTRRLGMHTGPIARKIEQLKAASGKADDRGFRPGRSSGRIRMAMESRKMTSSRGSRTSSGADIGDRQSAMIWRSACRAGGACIGCRSRDGTSAAPRCTASIR